MLPCFKRDPAGSLGPASLRSSRATMNRERDVSFSAKRPSAEAAPHHLHGLGAMRFQILDRAEHIVRERRVIEIGLAGPASGRPQMN